MFLIRRLHTKLLNTIEFLGVPDLDETLGIQRYDLRCTLDDLHTHEGTRVTLYLKYEVIDVGIPHT